MTKKSTFITISLLTITFISYTNYNSNVSNYLGEYADIYSEAPNADNLLMNDGALTDGCFTDKDIVSLSEAGKILRTEGLVK